MKAPYYDTATFPAPTPKRCGWCDGSGFTVCGVMCRTCGGRGWR